MLYSCIVVTVAQLYKFAKNHWTVHLQWLAFMVCKLLFSKAIFKKTEKNLNLLKII